MKRLGLDADAAPRMARRGELRRVSHGVYALPGSFAGPRERIIAAWLRLVGERLPWDRTPAPAVASHGSAATIHGFGTFPASPPAFTVAKRRHQPADDSIRLYTALLEPIDWEWATLPEGIEIPATTVARTIVDLAFSGEEKGHVLDALAEAREAGLVDHQDVAEAVTRRRHRRGRGNLQWLGAFVAET